MGEFPDRFSSTLKCPITVPCLSTERASVFLQILTSLYHANQVYGFANFMADYIAKNVQHPVSLAELSAEFNYSKNHIINLFKKEYGMTPYDYLTKKRIEKAQWLLESTYIRLL